MATAEPTMGPGAGDPLYQVFVDPKPKTKINRALHTFNKRARNIGMSISRTTGIIDDDASDCETLNGREDGMSHYYGEDGHVKDDSEFLIIHDSLVSQDSSRQSTPRLEVQEPSQDAHWAQHAPPAQPVNWQPPRQPRRRPREPRARPQMFHGNSGHRSDEFGYRSAQDLHTQRRRPDPHGYSHNSYGPGYTYDSAPGGPSYSQRPRGSREAPPTYFSYYDDVQRETRRRQAEQEELERSGKFWQQYININEDQANDYDDLDSVVDGTTTESHTPTQSSVSGAPSTPRTVSSSRSVTLPAQPAPRISASTSPPISKFSAKFLFGKMKKNPSRQSSAQAMQENMLRNPPSPSIASTGSFMTAASGFTSSSGASRRSARSRTSTASGPRSKAEEVEAEAEPEQAPSSLLGSAYGYLTSAGSYAGELASAQISLGSIAGLAGGVVAGLGANSFFSRAEQPSDSHPADEPPAYSETAREMNPANSPKSPKSPNVMGSPESPEMSSSSPSQLSKSPNNRRFKKAMKNVFQRPLSPNVSKSPVQSPDPSVVAPEEAAEPAVEAEPESFSVDPLVSWFVELFRNWARVSFILRPIDAVADAFPSLQNLVVIIELIMFMWLLYQLSIIIETVTTAVKTACMPVILICRLLGIYY